MNTPLSRQMDQMADAQEWKERAEAAEAKLAEAQSIVSGVNNSVFGSDGYFTTPDCRVAVEELKASNRKLRAEVERLREALGRVLTEAGLQAHKHGCANKIARPAQWDARLPCAGCQAESALQGR